MLGGYLADALDGVAVWGDVLFWWQMPVAYGGYRFALLHDHLVPLGLGAEFFTELDCASRGERYGLIALHGVQVGIALVIHVDGDSYRAPILCQILCEFASNFDVGFGGESCGKACLDDFGRLPVDRLLFLDCVP